MSTTSVRPTSRPASRGRDEGAPAPVRSMTMAKALNAGLGRAMEDDPKVLLAGEDIGKLGGVFRVTEGLQKDFGESRVIDTPLAESGIVGTAVGLALRGYRPVCEIQFDGFVFPAFDQIVTQVARVRWRPMGRTPMPPPKGMRMTTGMGTAPWVRQRIRATWVTIWSKAGKTNPSNWISHTGR